MNRIVPIAILSVILGAGAVVAQSDPVAERQAIMKQIGGATGQLTRMVRGEAPFDLAAAQAALKVYTDGGTKFPTLFSDSARNTGKAMPAVWEKKTEFQAAANTFVSEAQKAQASVKDLDGLKAALPAIGRQCGACHQPFRQPS